MHAKKKKETWIAKSLSDFRKTLHSYDTSIDFTFCKTYFGGRYRTEFEFSYKNLSYVSVAKLKHRKTRIKDNTILVLSVDEGDGSSPSTAVNIDKLCDRLELSIS